MQAGLPKNLLISELAGRNRVILLGGMAVIAHGLSRLTKDFDIWLEPRSSPEEWARRLTEVITLFPEATLWSLARRTEMAASEIANEARDVGVLRVTGMGLPVDIFRKPNELEVDDFERVWSGATIMEDSVGLPNELDLSLTKDNTDRKHDFEDQLFLQGKVKIRFRERLPNCSVSEGIEMMEKFADPEVLAFALENPHLEVREYALKLLHEFESEGDPYSRDILANWRARQI